jgi:hypothetical protein
MHYAQPTSDAAALTMLRSLIAFFVLWLAIGLPLTIRADEVKPQVNTTELPKNNIRDQPSSPQHIPTEQEITKAVTNGVDAAVQRYEGRHPPLPPDSSAWLFNLLLVVFTAMLVLVGAGQAYLFLHTLRATRKAADAAKQSADVTERALIDLEGPFLYPVIEHDDIHTSTRALAIYTHQSSIVNPVHPIVSFKLKNYGRSPAMLGSVSAVLFHGQPDDTHNDRLAGFASEMLIANGETSGSSIDRKMAEGIEREEYKSISAKTSRIFLRGSVIFFDVFGNRYEQKFCLAWEISTHQFIAWGANRNQRRRLSS